MNTSKAEIEKRVNETNVNIVINTNDNIKEKLADVGLINDANASKKLTISKNGETLTFTVEGDYDSAEAILFKIQQLQDKLVQEAQAKIVINDLRNQKAEIEQRKLRENMQKAISGMVIAIIGLSLFMLISETLASEKENKTYESLALTKYGLKKIFNEKILFAIILAILILVIFIIEATIISISFASNTPMITTTSQKQNPMVNQIDVTSILIFGFVQATLLVFLGIINSSFIAIKSRGINESNGFQIINILALGAILFVPNIIKAEFIKYVPIVNISKIGYVSTFESIAIVIVNIVTLVCYFYFVRKLFSTPSKMLNQSKRRKK
jgi:hypothetical protein